VDVPVAVVIILPEHLVATDGGVALVAGAGVDGEGPPGGQVAGADMPVAGGRVEVFPDRERAVHAGGGLLAGRGNHRGRLRRAGGTGAWRDLGDEAVAGVGIL